MRISYWSSDVCSSDLLQHHKLHKRPAGFPGSGHRCHRPSSAIFYFAQIPIDEPFDPLCERYLGTVSGERVDRRDVGIGRGYVARLHRPHQLDCRPAERALEHGDHVHQADGIAVADVEQPVLAARRRPVEHADHAVDDVVDIGEVTRHPAFAEHLDRLAEQDFLCEAVIRSEEHMSELQSLMRISYAVFCLKKKKKHTYTNIYSSKNIT